MRFILGSSKLTYWYRKRELVSLYRASGSFAPEETLLRIFTGYEDYADNAS